jgi:L-lactate dehydrogenase complex protein LldG
MSENTFDGLIEKVRGALGRTQPLTVAPVPPTIDEPITRLVHSDVQLTPLYLKSATTAKFLVEPISVGELSSKLLEFLKSRNCQNVGISVSPLWERLNLIDSLKAAGLKVQTWDELTLDASYDLDCGITDVWAAIAETGSLVIRPDPSQGRALSLVPNIHIAIVEPKNILADLVDLFEKVSRENPVPAITLISGPSQTADIEAVMVTGVHGPGVVKVFVLQ